MREPRRFRADCYRCRVVRAGAARRETPRRVPCDGTTVAWRCCDALDQQRMCCATAAQSRSTKALADGEYNGFGGRPGYDFLNGVNSWRRRSASPASIASLSAAHARYIGGARTKAGLQEAWKNC